MNWNTPERRKESRTTTDTIVYEPVLRDAAESQGERQQSRRDEWLDAGHRALFAVVVVVVLWLGMWIFWEPLEHYWAIAFVVGLVFAFQPMIASLNHRSRTQSAHRALDYVRHAASFQRENLALERQRHNRTVFGIESQTQVKQLAHRTEQRVMNAIDNRDMDSEYFLTCLQRGESPSKRSWAGRQLPSGQRMTAAKWSEPTFRT